MIEWPGPFVLILGANGEQAVTWWVTSPELRLCAPRVTTNMSERWSPFGGRFRRVVTPGLECCDEALPGTRDLLQWAGFPEAVSLAARDDGGLAALTFAYPLQRPGRVAGDQPR
jgi:hypothetical protein